MRKLSEDRSLIQCYCGSTTPDLHNNLECQTCGFFVHGACYRSEQSPVTCAPCSLVHQTACSDPGVISWYRDLNKMSLEEHEEYQYNGLLARLVSALSKGEHTTFFGSAGPKKPLTYMFLRIKFNIDQALAQKLFQSALEKGILRYEPDGTVEFKADEPEEALLSKPSRTELKPEDSEDGDFNEDDSGTSLLIRFPDLKKTEQEPSEYSGEEDSSDRNLDFISQKVNFKADCTMKQYLCLYLRRRSSIVKCL